MTNRNRRQILLSYRSDRTGFYTTKTFKYPLLAKDFYDSLSIKEKQKCDMAVKVIDIDKKVEYVIINLTILDSLIGAGNKSPKLLKGKKR